MPILGETTVAITGGFTYSNTSIERLSATAYTLGTLVIDLTGSLSGRECDMKKITDQIAEKLKGEDTAKNILWRAIGFNSVIDIHEFHGFRLLQDIDPARDYPKPRFQCVGMTNLFDAAGSAIEATLVEAKRLYDEDIDLNAITVVITDGDNNKSRLTALDIKEKTDIAIKGEHVESYRTILVGVNSGDSSDWDKHVTKRLKEFKDEAGFTEYIDLKQFGEKEMKRIILQVTSVTSDTSKVLTGGGGGQSQMIF